MSKSGDNRRIHGSGSLFQREDGMWVAAVLNPINKKQIRRYAKTKGKAEAHLREMLNNLSAGTTPKNTNITVKEYAAIWIAERSGLRRKETTVFEYQRRLRIHVLPHIGHKRLDAVTVKDVEKVLNVCKDNDAAKGMVTAVRNTLSAMYSDAVRDRDVSFNPVRGARLPVMQHKPKKKVPSNREVTELFTLAETLEGDNEQELVRILYILAYTGSRIGEVLAMKWTDLNFTENTWTVLRSASRNSSGHTIIGTSTKTSETRTINLPEMVVNYLQIQRQYLTYRRASMKVWDEQDLVFPGRFGSIIDEGNIRRFLKRTFPDWNHSFHAFRHWYASTAFQQGVDVVVTARALGHQSTSTTREVYGHLIPDASNQISDAVNRIIGQ